MRLNSLRRIVRATAFVASFLVAPILTVPVTAVAGIALSPIMNSWSHSKHSIEAMLTGRAPYDEARIRQDLQHYVASASRVASGVNGNTAEGRDFAARFKAFANDSQTVLGQLGKPSEARAGFERVVADCQDCHATYNN